VEPVTIAWQSSDLSRLHSTSAPAETPSSSSSTSTSSIETKSQKSHQDLPGPAHTTADHTHALAGGAAAGIGVGVAVGVLAIAGLIVWALFRHRKRKGQTATESSYAQYATANGREYGQDGRKHELEDERKYSELNAYPTRYELASARSNASRT
jgi:hypothetical protein